MENIDPAESEQDTKQDLPPRSSPAPSEIKTGSQSNKTRGTRKANTNQRWTLCQHWNTASQAKRLGWGAVLVSGLAALGNNVWSNLQTERNFEADHRPHIIVSRAPELLGSFGCQVTDNAMHFRTGAMRIWVKNIGRGDAINTFVASLGLQLVPQKKTGIQFFDDLRAVTEETCKTRATPEMKMFPLYAGLPETSVEIRQYNGTASLVKTNRLSVTLGDGTQSEPATPTGVDPGHVQIARDATFQVYNTICVLYSDRTGKPYGTCQTYALNVTGRPTISCPETPTAGQFVGTFGRYCDN